MKLGKSSSTSWETACSALSRDEAYSIRNAVTVAEVTRRIRKIPVEVPLEPEDGLSQKCVANLDTIITILKGTPY